MSIRSVSRSNCNANPDFASNNDRFYILNWNFLGSTDGQNWEIIKTHCHWIAPFDGAGKWKTFKIDVCAEYYRLLRIQLTGKHSGTSEFFSRNWSMDMFVVVEVDNNQMTVNMIVVCGFSSYSDSASSFRPERLP